MSQAVKKLEDSELYRAAAGIAKEIYGAQTELPEEEKWNTASKLRTGSVDLVADISEAEGTLDPRDAFYYFSRARKAAFSLKAVYRLAHDSGFIKLNPDLMMKLEKVVTDIDGKVSGSDEQISKWYERFDNPNKELRK